MPHRSQKWSAGLMSAVIWGSGQLWNRQYIKAAFFFLAQVGLIVSLPSMIHGLWGLITLGETEMIIEGSKVTPGDNSIILMILGIAWAIIAVVFVLIYIGCVSDAVRDRGRMEQGQHLQGTKEWFRRFRDRSFPYAMLIPAVILILLFVVVPILFGFLIAFTNYSAPHYLPPRSLVDWVGFSNFADMFRLPMWNDTFWGVLGWTLLWSVISTLSCYFGGLGMACLVNSRRVKFRKFWRTIYILPWAIPGLISLLIFRNMFNGPVWPHKHFPALCRDHISEHTLALGRDAGQAGHLRRQLLAGFPILHDHDVRRHDQHLAGAAGGREDRRRFAKAGIPPHHTAARALLHRAAAHYVLRHELQ